MNDDRRSIRFTKDGRLAGGPERATAPTSHMTIADMRARFREQFPSEEHVSEVIEVPEEGMLLDEPVVESTAEPVAEAEVISIHRPKPLIEVTEAMLRNASKDALMVFDEARQKRPRRRLESVSDLDLQIMTYCAAHVSDRNPSHGSISEYVRNALKKKFFSTRRTPKVGSYDELVNMAKRAILNVEDELKNLARTGEVQNEPGTRGYDIVLAPLKDCPGKQAMLVVRHRRRKGEPVIVSFSIRRKIDERVARGHETKGFVHTPPHVRRSLLRIA